ncbi:MAG TPA: hypothetical protein VK445_00260 [Dissulfurispiraceae bacterium]|nr:hypothetical protein [Dissulfurispiraceae bacterium]
MLTDILLFGGSVFFCTLLIARRYGSEVATWSLLMAWGSLLLGLTVN